MICIYWNYNYINIERKCFKYFWYECLSFKSILDFWNIFFIMIIFFNKNGFIFNENNVELLVFYKVFNRNFYSCFFDVLD